MQRMPDAMQSMGTCTGGTQNYVLPRVPQPLGINHLTARCAHLETIVSLSCPCKAGREAALVPGGGRGAVESELHYPKQKRVKAAFPFFAFPSFSLENPFEKTIAK